MGVGHQLQEKKGEEKLVKCEKGQRDDGPLCLGLHREIVIREKSSPIWDLYPRQRGLSEFIKLVALKMAGQGQCGLTSLFVFAGHFKWVTGTLCISRPVHFVPETITSETSSLKQTDKQASKLQTKCESKTNTSFILQALEEQGDELKLALELFSSPTVSLSANSRSQDSPATMAVTFWRIEESASPQKEGGHRRRQSFLLQDNLTTDCPESSVTFTVS